MGALRGWASNIRGSRVGIVLTHPGEVMMKKAVRLISFASNNEMEYEAFIASLRLPQEMRISKLQVKSNFQLVVN